MLQLSPKQEETTTQPSLETATLDVGRDEMCWLRQVSGKTAYTESGGLFPLALILVTEVAVVKYHSGAVEPETLAVKLTSRGFPDSTAFLKSALLLLNQALRCSRKGDSKKIDNKLGV